MLTQDIQNKIEEVVSGDIVFTSPLSSANNAAIYRLQMKDNSFLVAKIAPHGLEIEAYMLRYLKENSELPVPVVIHATDTIMIMEFIAADWQIDNNAQIHAAELLTSLHSIKAPQYGLEQDTLIGSIHQPNPQMDNWLDFFRDQRLLHMARHALTENRIDKNLMKKIDKLADKLDQFIDTSAEPSLIHGDVWGGNVLATRGKIAAFIDPAIYYADPEIELAFTTLFDTFGEPFFKRYHEISPIREDFFEARIHIYNLYPLLVHTRIFGTSYIRQIEKIVNRFV